MNMSFFNAAVGASTQQQHMNVQSNNIANINTYGFKAAKPSFSELLYRNFTGIDEEQLPRGTGAKMQQSGKDSSAGPLADTGRPQDYAIVGDGFFAVQDPQTNEVFYTRDGSFAMSQFQEDGETIYYLTDGSGRRVLNQDREPIRMEAGGIKFKQPVGVFGFENTDGMLHAGSNLFTPVEKNGQPAAIAGMVQQGALEMSNANLAYEFSKVIESQRVYSLSLKMVQTSDEIETTINGLSG